MLLHSLYNIFILKGIGAGRLLSRCVKCTLFIPLPCCAGGDGAQKRLRHWPALQDPGAGAAAPSDLDQLLVKGPARSQDPLLYGITVIILL
jgi:hypothetical protein